MAKLCEYRNCHNLGVRWLSGYCNQDHYERGRELELKEAIAKAKKAAAEKEKVITSTVDAAQGNHMLYGGAK
jgi:hypothetical protein